MHFSVDNYIKVYYDICMIRNWITGDFKMRLIDQCLIVFGTIYALTFVYAVVANLVIPYFFG